MPDRSSQSPSVPLSSLIRETVKLTKTGKEWKGLCPFHQETTPSFYVNDEKGFFHCFGCAAHGDANAWILRGATSQIDKQEIDLVVKKGGGKLNRSETVTVRLDPKLNYLCELASRAKRRTKSSFIEWAVAEALGNININDRDTLESSGNQSLKNLAPILWHVDEADRVVALSLAAPNLLTHEEQMIWRLIRENGYIWRGRYNHQGDWEWDLTEESLIRNRLRASWSKFKAVASQDEPESILPQWIAHKGSDFDDDIPF